MRSGHRPSAPRASTASPTRAAHQVSLPHLVAPCPQSARPVVELVLVSEADRAVHLVRHLGAAPGGLADARSWPPRRRARRRRRRCRAPRAAASAAACAAAASPASTASSCCTAWNWPMARPNWMRSRAYSTVMARMCCERAAHQRGAGERAEEAHALGRRGVARRGDRALLERHSVEADGVAGLAGEVGVLDDGGAPARHDCEPRSLRRQHRHHDGDREARERNGADLAVETAAVAGSLDAAAPRRRRARRRRAAPR